MSPRPYLVTAEDARSALGFAYLKGNVDDPLPPLRAKEVRALVTRMLQEWGPGDVIWWADRLRHWPSERDPRTEVQIIDEVTAWAEARVRRYISHYRPKDPRYLFTIPIDPEKFRNE